MKGYILALLGIAVGCAATAAGLGPSPTIGQTGGARAVDQYCTDTGDVNNTAALDSVVRQAGAAGFELVAVARAAPVGLPKVDYVCFRRAR